MGSMRFLLLSLVLLAPSLAAEEPADPGLVFIRLNEQGAEEWYRVKDGGTVIRIPGGDYLRRPYEGRVATQEPKSFPVKSFYIDKYEVTNAQFARFLNAQEAGTIDGLVDPSIAGVVERDGRWIAQPGRERHPVTAATGRGAAAFAAWVGGRIPEVFEWEKAAGGSEGLLYPWGEARPDATRASFGQPKLRGTMPVGSFSAGVSPYGCLDMAGNVYDRTTLRRRGRPAAPVVLKGGSWLSPHPLNLRVLDMCMQPMEVADRSVGFRCAMDDPEPGRPVRKEQPRKTLKLAKSWKAAVEEARRRHVPIFLSLQHDTCGQCDRTRAQLFEDPRFVAYCKDRMVVAVGHDPRDAEFDPHPENDDGSCTLYEGLDCVDHLEIYRDALRVVEVFRVSPGNFVLHPDRCEAGAGAKAILVPERDLPKWGRAVDVYLAAFEKARAAVAQK